LLPLRRSAEVTVTRRQKRALLLTLVVAVLLVVLLGPARAAVALVAVISFCYLADLAFMAWVVWKGAGVRHEDTVIDLDDPPIWPTYSVLCPMYREGAVLQQFVDAMLALDYPTDRLEILLLLEEDDVETIEAAERLDLPSHFRIVVIPDSLPRTKPKACNVALAQISSEYCVIYDSEDVPEPDQLKQAARVFRRSSGRVACLQAQLNFYNPRQNTLTRLFTAEYSVWFDLLLVGLHQLGGPIPLGGTSNHFRTYVLQGLGGWDPHNVTEDCDLGIRLYRQGFRTEMLNSTTYEEANSDLGNWIRQRSRWIKGYMQTLLVHTRGQWDTRRRFDPHYFTFLLLVGGKVLVNFINPIMWLLTIGYFAARSSVGEGIESLFPAPVYGMAIASLVLGNALFIYLYLVGSARRGNWDLVKYGLLAPLYWLAMSVASVKALWQLIRRPHYWEKTVHGLHLQTEAAA
jgi:cellulose synthase/poly-beta-1,6-N-acetylglucosamine synthase-like glycosyltransferase